MAATVWAQKPDDDLTTKSLEDLMDIEVTSVSKKEERLFQTAAAVYVITQEEIRRSGLTSIPELLRMVPGLQVARIDGSKWAISARGFNGRFSDKLLVMVDGRSIYSPETSGVWWEVQDLLIEDIERIEVIRGPGGTLWGANAVNGVINIITRRAQDTQGGLMILGSGSEEQGLGGIRYGGKIGKKAYYRLYGKYFKRSGLVDENGNDVNDSHQALRGGGRMDWQLTDRDFLTVSGDIYHTHLHDTSTNFPAAAPFVTPFIMSGNFDGGNLTGRWTHVYSERSETSLQVYYDRFSRNIFDLPERNNALDIDFQHHIAASLRHNVVWGLGYRLSWDKTDTTSRTAVQYDPKSRTVQLFSLFAQDEITLVKDRLKLMVGSKVEHNDFSGFEAQPSIRVLYLPSSRSTVWGAVSRAAATTSRKDEDLRVNVASIPNPEGPPILLAVFGNKNFESQTVTAYEAGYRAQAGGRITFDLATFYNSYNRLRTIEPGRPFLETDPQPAHLIFPLVFDNLMRGETYGGEVSINLNATNEWKLACSYSLLRLQLRRTRESVDTTSEESGEGSSPQHQFQIHSYYKLPRNLELDASLYHVSRLPYLPVPSYTRLDLRFGWRMSERIEFSAGGQNLLNDRHLEFTGDDAGVLSSQVKRSAYGKLTWRF